MSGNVDPYKGDFSLHGREWFLKNRKKVNATTNEKPIYVSVDDIDNPEELAEYKGYQDGHIAIAYEDEQFTIYLWSTDGTEDSPFVVAGEEGYWNAAGGKYINSYLHVPIGKGIIFGNGTTNGDVRFRKSSTEDAFLIEERIADAWVEIHGFEPNP